MPDTPHYVALRRTTARSERVRTIRVGRCRQYAAKIADMEEVEVVVAHNERATLRVGDVFLKIDADQT
jgi:hypothetical protein